MEDQFDVCNLLLVITCSN